MMNEIFLKLFNMSITASWVIMAVIVLRFFLQRAPKWLRCVLWAIVAVRLVCPFSFESVFSLIPSAEPIKPAAVQFTGVPNVNTEKPVVSNTLSPVIGNTNISTSGNSEISPETWIFAASFVWIGGLTILLGYALISFLRIRRKVEEGVLLYDNVYLCDAARSPFILGIIRPRIYMPSDMEEMQLGYVLAHERAHLKRKDHWWKPFGYALLAVYWFNPLVWLAYILLCRDIELACDEKAVHDLNMAGRKAYSKALVACSMKRRMIMACPLAFGEVGVKERVKTVLNYRKPAFWLIILAVAACVAAALCFLTDPRNDDGLAEMIDAQKEELTQQIGTVISEAEAVRYSITDWNLVVKQIDGKRADCAFGANWISSRKPEDDPMIQGMYQTADSLSDETQKALALETADGWLVEMQSWPQEEYLEQPIVIMQEGSSLVLYYPYVLNGVETLIPLQKFVDENWTEDSEKRYKEGVNIIGEALIAASLNMPEFGTPDSGMAGSDMPGNDEAESNAPGADVSGSNAPGANTTDNNIQNSNVPDNNMSELITAYKDVSNHDMLEGEIKEGINYYDLKAVYSDSLLIDEIEWIRYTDTERAAELGLDVEQFGAPYYIYNETVSDIRCPFAEECSFTLLNWYNSFEPLQVNKQTFLDTMVERESVYNGWSEVPFIIEIADGKIISVTEQYVQ